jgi:hypothetical protein
MGSSFSSGCFGNPDRGGVLLGLYHVGATLLMLMATLKAILVLYFHACQPTLDGGRDH